MTDTVDLLFELGTEELPPVALKRLSDALSTEFIAGLDRANLKHGEVTAFATPRRLGLLIHACAVNQPDREVERRGPALQAAFDQTGKATRAAEGFARSCGTGVEHLGRIKTDKGEWLTYRLLERGKAASALLPEIAETALNSLPIPKRMRWGSSEAQFVRPVHWLLFLHGEEIVPCTILDARAGRLTYGHRFHYPHAIEIKHPAEYAGLLEHKGSVIARFDQRREKIREQVERTADTLGGRAEIDPELLDEVTALVEWPVPIAAGFEEEYLQVPHEALILSMKKNQKYFHLVDNQNRLMNHFVTIANIDSPTPEVIKEGNERVIRPRLSDAMFFWQQDGKRPLESHLESLKSVVFQLKLGTLFEKSERVSRLAAFIAGEIEGNPEMAARAALLSRCDLMTEMVGEFPDMQGVMGRYQADRDGEAEELALAMEEFYMPRFSGDQLARTRTGIAISIADRLDTLVGIFGIGQKPTGDKDPFALRRAALGVLRNLKEHVLPLNLRTLLETSADTLGARVENSNVVADVYDFMLERLKGLYQDEGVSINVFEAVVAVKPETVADFDRRIHAVLTFVKLPEAEALTAANKRIGNILKKSGEHPARRVSVDLFEGAEEISLHQHISDKEAEVAPLLKTFRYEEILVALSGLRDPVDRFFDNVMVMTDDVSVRSNRLALLNRLNLLFLGVADISRI
ncbi:MAG TPA: glycine--tRNA ligase subunit beta [Gammaproteobacteria bacterium]|nr:glycine--tRNA ligase subunit beta [Gammaproteobacteria bacterium]